VIQVVDQD